MCLWGGSKVREAAGVFFIVTGNDEHGLVEAVVAELLEGDGGCDGGEHGDVCGGNRKLPFTLTHTNAKTQISGRFTSFLTEFDGETGRELHLNELPEFVKVLEGRDHLQHVQQPGRERVVRDGKAVLCQKV